MAAVQYRIPPLRLSNETIGAFGGNSVEDTRLIKGMAKTATPGLNKPLPYQLEVGIASQTREPFQRGERRKIEFTPENQARALAPQLFPTAGTSADFFAQDPAAFMANLQGEQFTPEPEVGQFFTDPAMRARDAANLAFRNNPENASEAAKAAFGETYRREQRAAGMQPPPQAYDSAYAASVEAQRALAEDRRNQFERMASYSPAFAQAAGNFQNNGFSDDEKAFLRSQAAQLLAQRENMQNAASSRVAQAQNLASGIARNARGGIERTFNLPQRTTPALSLAELQARQFRLRNEG